MPSLRERSNLRSIAHPDTTAAELDPRASYRPGAGDFRVVPCIRSHGANGHARSRAVEATLAESRDSHPRGNRPASSRHDRDGVHRSCPGSRRPLELSSGPVHFHQATGSARAASYCVARRWHKSRGVSHAPLVSQRALWLGARVRIVDRRYDARAAAPHSAPRADPRGGHRAQRGALRLGCGRQADPWATRPSLARSQGARQNDACQPGAALAFGAHPRAGSPAGLRGRVRQQWPSPWPAASRRLPKA